MFVDVNQALKVLSNQCTKVNETCKLAVHSGDTSVLKTEYTREVFNKAYDLWEDIGRRKLTPTQKKVLEAQGDLLCSLARYTI